MATEKRENKETDRGHSFWDHYGQQLNQKQKSSPEKLKWRVRKRKSKTLTAICVGCVTCTLTHILTWFYIEKNKKEPLVKEISRNQLQ